MFQLKTKLQHSNTLKYSPKIFGCLNTIFIIQQAIFSPLFFNITNSGIQHASRIFYRAADIAWAAVVCLRLRHNGAVKIR